MKKTILSTVLLLALLLLGMPPAIAEAPQSTFRADHTFRPNESYRMFHITDVGGGQDLSFDMNMDKEATFTLNVKTDDNPNYFNKTEKGTSVSMSFRAEGKYNNYYFYVRNETDETVFGIAEVYVPLYMPPEEDESTPWQTLDGVLLSIVDGESGLPVITMGIPGGEMDFAVSGGLPDGLVPGALVHVHYREEADAHIADSVTITAPPVYVDLPDLTMPPEPEPAPEPAPVPQWVEGSVTLEGSTLLAVGGVSLLAPGGLPAEVTDGALVHVDYHLEPGRGNIIDWIAVFHTPEDPMPGPVEQPPEEPLPQ